MPAIPIIAAGAQVAGGIQQNKAAKDAQGAVNRNQEWQRYIDQLNTNQGYQSAQNWEAEQTPALDWNQSVTQATAQATPMFDEEMKNTLEQQANANKRRGFYGQAPGDLLMQERGAEVEGAKQQYIGNMANQLQQASQTRSDQQKQFGVGQFGTYGNVIAPEAIGSNVGAAASTKRKTSERILDPLGIVK